MVYLEAGSMAPCTFLNLQELTELKPTRRVNGSLVLGALTTYRDVRISRVKEQFPMLALAAREIGALAIQNRGTWAGNIANASPAADGVPALMAYDAQIELASKDVSRSIPLSEFYRGYKQMDRRPDELITAIHVPCRSRAGVSISEKSEPGASRQFQKLCWRAEFDSVMTTRLKT